METTKLTILRGEILKLTELIMDQSFGFCKSQDYHTSLMASKVNDAAHKISKLAAEIPV